MKAYIIKELNLVESQPNGAILQWLSPGYGTVEVLSVGMSWKSLAACRRALDRSKVDWEITDGSLRVSGTNEKVELTFRIAGPPVEYRTLILEGESLVNFKGVLDQLKP
jgi:hypothetical protein